MSGLLEIWRFTDGKRGHENQSRGLVEALGRIVPVRCHDWAVAEVRAPFWRCLAGGLPQPPDANRPQLAVGAGSRTHWAVLAAKRSTGAAAIAIMRPHLLMRGFFDLCLVPQMHNAGGAKIIATRGALNAVQPGGAHAVDRGLILIGGPSKHYGWDQAGTLDSVRGLVQAERDRRWKLTTSRRTPASTAEALQKLGEANLEVCPVEATDDAWVPAELARAAVVWVTEESVSMVYEALTSGACVGVLPVPRRRPRGTLSKNIDQLLAEHWCTSLEAWREGIPLRPPPEQMDEASRCARIVLQRLGLA